MNKISEHQTDHDWVADVTWSDCEWIVEGDLDGWEPVVHAIYVDAGEKHAEDNPDVTDKLKDSLINDLSLAATEIVMDQLAKEADEIRIDNMIQNAIEDGRLGG